MIWRIGKNCWTDRGPSHRMRVTKSAGHRYPPPVDPLSREGLGRPPPEPFLARRGLLRTAPAAVVGALRRPSARRGYRPGVGRVAALFDLDRTVIAGSS